LDKFAFHLEKLFMLDVGRKSIRFIVWLVVIFSGSIFFSCANEDCVSVFNNDLLVGFIKADTLASGQIEFHEADTLFYSITAIGNDTIFYDSTNIASTFVLPVNPADDLTTFRFEVIDSIRYDTLTFDPIEIETIYYVNPIPHTITVSYDRKHRIISEDCGTEIAYINLNIEEISFSTTNLAEDKLSRFNEVNIEVFF